MNKIIVYLVVLAMSVSFAFAAVGDLLADRTMSTVSAFSNVGVAFDGTVLYVPDGTTTIQLISPADGSQVGTLATSPAVNFGAMAFDAKRNVLWACSNGIPNKLYKVDLPSGTTTLIKDPLPPNIGTFCDGLAYDENDPTSDSDDRIWYSPDVSPTTFELDLAGNTVDSFLSGISCGNSGIAVGGTDLYLSNDGCDQIQRFDKVSKANLGLFSAPGDRPEDLECDPVTFPGKDAIWVRMFENNHLKAYEILDDTCGIGGHPPSVCGNEIVEPPEQCDDGNQNDNDGCSANCTIEEGPPNEIPEFTVIGGGIALLGAAGYALYRRRK